MPDWVCLVVFFLAYLVFMQWLLPKLGVPSKRGNSGSVESRPSKASVDERGK